MEPTLATLRLDVLNVSPKTNWSFVEVGLNDGSRAWGEASLNAWEPLLRGAVERLQFDLAGQTLETTASTLKASPWSPGGLVQAAAISAVQQACLDLIAQQRGLSWSHAMGPLRRDRVPAYANINRATTDRTPNGFAATARCAVEQGFRAFKAAPFDGVTPATCASTEGRRRTHHGIDCLMALREAIGPGAGLMVDCHWRFDEPRAREVLQALAPVRLHWFECPLPETPPYWPALKRLHSAARDQGVLLAGAETQIGCAGFQPLFDAGLYDVVMPDVKYCGGPWEMLRIAERAQAAGVQFSPHNPTGPIASLHSLAVAGVAPQCDLIELQFDESPLFAGLLPGRHPDLVDGAFAVPASVAWPLHPVSSLWRDHPYQPVPSGVESLAAG